MLIPNLLLNICFEDLPPAQKCPISILQCTENAFFVSAPYPFQILAGALLKIIWPQKINVILHVNFEGSGSTRERQEKK